MFSCSGSCSEWFIILVGVRWVMPMVKWAGCNLRFNFTACGSKAVFLFWCLVIRLAM